MPKQGFYSKQEVEASGLPFWTGTCWVGEFPDICVLLTKSRCKHFGCPVSDEEKPVAFRFTANGPGEYKFTPVYDRTSRFIDDRLLLHFEFVTSPKDTESEKKLLDLKNRRYQLQQKIKDKNVDKQQKRKYRKELVDVQREIDEIEE